MTLLRSLRRRQLFAAATLPLLAPASLAAPAQRRAAPGMTALTYASTFPADFVFGVAAASAQIEGAAFKDGKGESVWDRFARIPGKVYQGHTPDVACDTVRASVRGVIAHETGMISLLSLDGLLPEAEAMEVAA